MAVEGNGRVYQWAVRGPGMPQKILRSDKELTEQKIRDLYLLTVARLSDNVHRGDSEVPWKIIQVSDADIQKAGLGWCLKETRRRNHLALLNVVGGKLVGGTFNDKGKFVADLKPVKPVKKTKTKVDVALPQPK